MNAKEIIRSLTSKLRLDADLDEEELQAIGWGDSERAVADITTMVDGQPRVYRVVIQRLDGLLNPATASL